MLTVFDLVQRFEPGLQHKSARQTERQDPHQQAKSKVMECFAQINPFGQLVHQRQRSATVMQDKIPFEDRLSDQSRIDLTQKVFHLWREERRSDSKGKKHRCSKPNSGIHNSNETQEGDHAPTLKKICRCAKPPFLSSQPM